MYRKIVTYSALQVAWKDWGGWCLYIIHPWPEAICSKASQRVAQNNQRLMIHSGVPHGPTGGKHNEEFALLKQVSFNKRAKPRSILLSGHHFPKPVAVSIAACHKHWALELPEECMVQVPKRQDSQPKIWPGNTGRHARYSLWTQLPISLFLYIEFFLFFMADVSF